MAETLLLKISETLTPLPRLLFFYFPAAYTWHNFRIFLAALAFIYLSFLLGDIFFRLLRLDFSSNIKRFTYQVLSGWGMFGLAGLAAALLGFFNPFFLRFFSLFVLAISLGRVWAHLRFLANPGRLASLAIGVLRDVFRENTVLKLILAFWLAINFFIVFVPVTGWDALYYHLPIMADLMRENGLTFSASVSDRYPHLTLGAEIIYAVPMVIFGNTFPPSAPSIFPPDMPLRERIPLFNNSSSPFIFQVLQYGALIFILLLVYDFLRQRIGNKFLLVVALLMILAIFDLQREVMHGGYVDVFTALFGLASTLLIMENYCRRTISSSELCLSAFLLGIALGMKYVALLFLAINGLFLLGAFWRSRIGLAGAAAKIVPYTLIILAVAGFWYAKNLAWFGNPVYPMFSDPKFEETGVGIFTAGRTPLNFFLFPFYVFGQRFLNPDETSSRLIVFGYFAVLYALLAFFAATRRKFGSPELLLLVFIELFLLFSFFTTDFLNFATKGIRFMLSPLIMVPALLVLLLDRLGEDFKAALRVRTLDIMRRTFYSATILVFLVLLLGNIHYFNIRFNYLTGIYTEELYVGEIGWQ